MTPIEASVIIGVATVFMSGVTSAVIIGIAWGKMQATITAMGKDLAEIKGMFRLTLKE